MKDKKVQRVDFFSKWEFALWKATKFGHDRAGNPIDRPSLRNFQRQCHNGFDHAQKLLVELVAENRANESITLQSKKYREILIRKVADCIAMSVCGGGPAGVSHWCTQANPVHINLEELSIVSRYVARKNAEDRNQFHLLADLTSCIHTCDILRIDFRKGAKQLVTPMEMKTGRKNAQLYNQFVAGVTRKLCPSNFVSTHSRHEIEQMLRIVKQTTTLYQSTKNFNEAFRNLHTEFNAYPLYSSTTYSKELTEALDIAKEQRQASVIIDRCLFLTVGYDEDQNISQMHALEEMNLLINNLPVDALVRRFNPLADNLASMVCIPFCIWELRLNDRLLLAKKKLVLECALLIEPFLKMLGATGNDFQLASKKESAILLAQTQRVKPWQWGHRVLKMPDGALLSGELLQPMSTDLVYPRAIIQNIFRRMEPVDNSQCLPEPNIRINFEYF